MEIEIDEIVFIIKETFENIESLKDFIIEYFISKGEEEIDSTTKL